jgi:hypothetical protein
MKYFSFPKRAGGSAACAFEEKPRPPRSNFRVALSDYHLL